jgi:hypothetical protein
MKGMKVLAAVGVAAAVAAGIASAADAKVEALFNGKDLDGWGAFLVDPNVTMADVWSVKDGILVCRGEPMGYLHTKRTFTNFKLIVEWRWAPGGKAGNSGVLLRVNGEPKGLPRCIECQLKSGDAGAIYGFHGMKVAGAADRFMEKTTPNTGEMRGVKKIEGAENPPGEWNVYEIELAGGVLTAKVNGKKVNEATGCEVVAGQIGLQSEGGEIHFRKVCIEPLP